MCLLLPFSPLAVAALLISVLSGSRMEKRSKMIFFPPFISNLFFPIFSYCTDESEDVIIHIEPVSTWRKIGSFGIMLQIHLQFVRCPIFLAPWRRLGDEGECSVFGGVLLPLLPSV